MPNPSVSFLRYLISNVLKIYVVFERILVVGIPYFSISRVHYENLKQTYFYWGRIEKSGKGKKCSLWPQEPTVKMYLQIKDSLCISENVSTQWIATLGGWKNDNVDFSLCRNKEESNIFHSIFTNSNRRISKILICIAYSPHSSEAKPYIVQDAQRSIILFPFSLR